MLSHSETATTRCFRLRSRFLTSWFTSGKMVWSSNRAGTKGKYMCGISGIVNFNATEPASRRLIEAMTTAQAHRGPNGHGYFVENNVALGHRRLSIIDLEGGKQPMYNEDESVV